jgi:hypothetical protein
MARRSGVAVPVCTQLRPSNEDEMTQADIHWIIVHILMTAADHGRAIAASPAVGRAGASDRHEDQHGSAINRPLVTSSVFMLIVGRNSIQRRPIPGTRRHRQIGRESLPHIRVKSPIQKNPNCSVTIMKRASQPSRRLLSASLSLSNHFNSA